MMISLLQVFLHILIFLFISHMQACIHSKLNEDYVKHDYW